MKFEPPNAEEIKSIFPQFKDVRFLNAGGFKAVYKVVVDVHYEAFKIVHIPETSGVEPEVSNEIRKESAGRIAREIRILNDCKSPEIVKLGTIQPKQVILNNREYVAYSEGFLDGNTLRELTKQSVRPSEEDLRSLFISLLKAIRELWSLNVIHRDIKPDNVMNLNRRDRSYVLLDLGIAFSINDTPLTFNGANRLPGTYRYLAPEMLQPGFRESLDFRSDIYSAALTIYEYAAGQHPLAKSRDDLIATLSRIVRESPKSLGEYRADLSPFFIGTIDQMLKKIPALRPSNINMLIDKLEKNV